MNKLTFVILSSCILMAGCQTTRENAHTGETETNSKTIGAITGAIGGAIVGIATSSKKDRKKGALIGATTGAVIGGVSGHYLDQQEQALREKLRNSGVQVKRIGENHLQLEMAKGIGFDTGSSHLTSSVHSSLDSIGEILKEFPKTTIEINGHTDSVGSAQSNQILSEQRAQSVLGYLSSIDVARNRLLSYGKGENLPKCDNTNATGRACNRRVEINIINP